MLFRSASFLNGLVITEGRYLNTRGQPSSYDILQDENHNSFTYMIDVEKEIAKYRDILLNLLHPSGMKLVGRYVIESGNNFTFGVKTVNNLAYPLNHYGEDILTANISMEVAEANDATNIVTFNDIGTINIADIFVANSTSISIGFEDLPVYSLDRKSTRLNSSHTDISRMPSSA